MPNGYGRILKSEGGWFTVRLSEAHGGPLDGCTVQARARGVLRGGSLRTARNLLAGDLVEVGYDESSYTVDAAGKVTPSTDGTGIRIDRVLPRRNALIRPPLANLDFLFVTLAVRSPAPDLETVDKLTCIAVHQKITPVIVITKRDLDAAEADRLAKIYRSAGMDVYPVSSVTGEGIDALKARIFTEQDKLAAFAGASGVGKSTLLNRLFPHLSLATGDLSRRIARGKNTTRTVTLYPLADDAATGYLADTPGFTMLDFGQFDFFRLDDLPATFPEFAPYLGSCRYTDCTHTKEEECAIVRAVRTGEISPSRHQTYCTLYGVLKKKPSYPEKK